MSRGDGSFKPSKWVPFDDDIDYSLWDSSTPGNEDATILTTPVVECITNHEYAAKHCLLSCDVQNLKYLPKLSATPSELSIAHKFLIANYTNFIIQQQMLDSDRSTIPPQMWDPAFMVVVCDDLLEVNGDSYYLSSDNFRTYVIPSDSNQIENINSATILIRGKNITPSMWNSIGHGDSPNRHIITRIRIIGATSGIKTDVIVTILENY
ncbi:MAG: hypothetical protein WC438_05615 [Candidatus Pacearchaeota archaeon]